METKHTKNYFEDCKTLDEAKSLYYKLAMQLHPDKGGNTADFQELLHQFESFRPRTEKFQGEADQWKAQEYAHIIDQLIKIPGIIIEICGSWVWITGNTKPHKDEIKSIDPGESFKRGFNRKKEAWYFSPKSYRKRSRQELDLDQIRDLYGSQKVDREREEKNNKRYIN